MCASSSARSTVPRDTAPVPATPCTGCLRTLERAVELHRGDLLSGFELRDSAEFDTWLMVRNEGLRSGLTSALERLASGYASSGRHAEALGYAQRWSALDPTDEAAHRMLMRLHAWSGHPASALRQYALCERILRAEGGDAPQAETAELCDAIRQGRLEPDAAARRHTPAPAATPEVRVVTAVVVRGAATALGRRLEALLESHGGMVVHRSDRDVAAVFGVKESHEDDPDRALLAARAAGRNVSVGVDTGACLVQGNHARGGPIDGARRLCRQARRGRTLVGERTRLAARGTGRRTASSARDCRLVGRQEEIARLRRAVSATASGKGWAVCLIGEAGLGKSRLIREIRGASPAGVDWLAGGCQELGTGTAYWPFLGMLREWMGVRLGQAPRAAGRRLRAELHGLLAGGHIGAEACDELGPVLGELLSVRCGTDWDGHLVHASPEELRHRRSAALVDLVSALARRRPLVLVLEDLHWSDSLSLDVLHALLPIVRQAPLCLVLSFRPDTLERADGVPHAASGACGARFTEVRLGPLGVDESTELARALGRGSMERATEELVLSQCEGNPLYIQEVVRSARATSAGDLPETLQGVVQARMDRLEPEQKRLLRTAAVAGHRFSEALLQSLGEPVPRVTGFVHVEQESPPREYAFDHELIRSAIYASVPAEERRAEHFRIGAALEELYRRNLAPHCAELAHHFDAGGSRAKAAQYLVAAGEEAARAYLWDESNADFLRALERTSSVRRDPAVEPEIADFRLRALAGLGKWYAGRDVDSVEYSTAASRYLIEALRIGRRIGLPSERLAVLFYWLGKSYTHYRPDLMDRVGRQGQRLLGQDPDSAESLLMEWLVVYSRMDRGDREAVRALATVEPDTVRRLPYSPEIVTVLVHVVWGHTRLKNTVDATAIADMTEARARAQHDSFSLAMMITSRGRHVLAPAGDIEGAVRCVEQATQLHRGCGSAFMEKRGHQMLAEYALRCGRTQEVHRQIESGREAACRGGITADTSAELWYGAASSLRLGDWNGAIGGLRRLAVIQARWYRAHGQSPARGSLGVCAETWMLLARAYDGAGEREKALRSYRRAAEALASRPYSAWFDLSWVVTQPAMAPAVLSAALAGIERTGSRRAASALCRRLARTWTTPVGFRLPRLLPEPATPVFVGRHLPCPASLLGRRSPWRWIDPFEDSERSIAQGMVMRARCGRGLYSLNESAPRLVVSAPGDVAIQAACEPADARTPTVGGIVLWRDRFNYLALHWGLCGTGTVLFHGWVDNEFVVVGRGWTREAHVTVRLEREAGTVRALYSSDGVAWLSVGASPFPIPGPVDVGLFVDAMFLWEVVAGDLSRGSAVRFTGIEVTAARGGARRHVA